MNLQTILAIVVVIGSSTHATEGNFDHSHASLTVVLRESVTDARVNYAALKKDPADLDAYLDTLATVRRVEFDAWTKPQRLAFLINLYNATTIKLVIDHYPVKSIKDIGGYFSGPWKQKIARAFGEAYALDQIENDMIRARYGEPRTHFALVCASIGCPPLRAEAYDAARLEGQLDDQARIFLGTTRKNRVDAKDGILFLSPIFKWFEKDFSGKAGSVAKFIAPYFNDSDKTAILGGGLRVQYTEYDWSLNKQ